MNAGLCNLDTLKKHLLANSIGSAKQFDLQVKLIGAGVRGVFETFCNRRLGYVENDTVEFSGDRPHYYLPRFPISGISKVEMRYFQSDDWTEITDQPISISYETGLIHFGYTLGRTPLRVRATWSGGYWFQTAEPEADPITKPEITDELALRNGAQVADLPDELLSAFLWQCEAIWAVKDKLGMGTAEKPGTQSNLADIKLSPLVETILRKYVRYQLS